MERLLDLTSPPPALPLPLPLPAPVLSSPRRTPTAGAEEGGMQPPQQYPPAPGSWGGVAGARAGATTVDEASMERSKSFIKALQVLPEPRIPRSIHAHAQKSSLFF